MSNPPNAVRPTYRYRRFAIYAAGAVLVIGLVAWVVGRTFGTPSDLDAAEQALRRNDALGAWPPLKRALARQPDDERTLLLAARAARRIDDYSAAERFLTALEDRAGPTDASRMEWALVGVQQGDFGTDEARLRSALGRDPAEDLAILEALAKGYAASYRWADAQAALGKLLEREPTHVPALVLRGAISDRFRRTEPAEEDLRRAVAAAPDNALAQTALADLLSHHGHAREAIYHYELALRVSPDRVASRLGLARALTDDANLTGAGEQLDAILAADANHANALIERGRLALRRGRFSEAEPFLARATQAAAGSRDAHQLYLVALKELGRTGEAARCEARLAELAAEDATGGRLKLRARDNRGDPDVRMELWEWSVRTGEIEEGRVWLGEILRADPHNARARAALADYFTRAGQPRRAAQHRAAAGK
jgi:Tfp pilus assembly protein PilF